MAKAKEDIKKSVKDEKSKKSKSAPSGELTMEELLQENEDKGTPLEEDEVVEGIVVSVTKAGIWLDLGVHGTGLAVGSEAAEAGYKDSLPGDKINTSVIIPEMDEGYALLSLRKASREKNWELLREAKQKEEIIKIKPFDANKGGLLVEYEGIKGFLPVSQLSTENYPRVSDKEEILNRLSTLIGKTLDVVILDTDKNEGKLIFSEKEARKGEITSAISSLEIGAKVKGKVTGVVDFGIFVNVEGVEGLVHISEISWDRVEDPKKFAKVGDTIDVTIIGKDQDKVSLSLKRLQDDPWAKEINDIKVGDIIEGEVTRITPFGAFVKVTKSIEALVHISELSEDHIANPSEVVEVGKAYKFKIISVDSNNHKLALSLKEVSAKSAKSATLKTSNSAKVPLEKSQNDAKGSIGEKVKAIKVKTTATRATSKTTQGDTKVS